MLPISNTHGNNVTKRKRVVLSVETKLQIVERVMNGEAFTKLSREYGIGAQTCRDIFNNRDKLVNFAFSSGTVGACLKRKTLKRANFHDIDKAVYQWFQQQRSEGLPVTGPMLIEKALWFHREMQISEPFSASSGWLSKFKARYNIRQPKTRDDKLVADEPLVDKFKSEFKKIVKQNNFTLDQIYLADEKLLRWNYFGGIEKISDKESLISNMNSDHDTENVSNIDPISVMACANANGSKKLKLFCTGKHETVDSFNENNCSLVNYYTIKNDKNSYEISLNNWFHNIFIPEVKQDLNAKSLPEKALLVIKNDDSYFIENDSDIEIKSSNDNFFVIFLPKVISELPQMSLSSKDIITHYIKSKLIPMIEDNCIKNEHFSSNILFDETLYAISDAWNNIKDERMQHSSWWWHNLFTEMENENIIERREGIVNHFMTSSDNIMNDENVNSSFIMAIKNIKTEIEECQTNLDEDNFDFQTNCNLAINNIKNEVKEENEESQTDFDFQANCNVQNDLMEFQSVIKIEMPSRRQKISETGDFNLASCSQSKVVSTSDAISCTNLLLRYLEQQNDSSYNEILIVKNIRKKLKEKLKNNNCSNGR